MKNADAKVYLIARRGVYAACRPENYSKYREKGWTISKHINMFSTTVDNYGVAVHKANPLNLEQSMII